MAGRLYEHGLAGNFPGKFPGGSRKPDHGMVGVRARTRDINQLRGQTGHDGDRYSRGIERRRGKTSNWKMG